MFNFGGITHVFRNPVGTLSLAGSVPLAMMAQRTPTASDIMAGRTRDGVAYVDRAYASVEDVRAAAQACNAKLCDSPTCACRSILG